MKKQPKYRRLSPEEEQRIIALYLQGHSTGAVARMTRRAESTVVRTCQRAGVHRPSIRELREMTADELERARYLYEQGFSFREVAALLGRHPSTVRLRIKEMDVEIRRPYGHEQKNIIRVPAKRIMQAKFLYTRLQMSGEQIAAVMKVSPNTVRRDLRLAGVEVRSRSEAVALSYSEGRRELAPQCRSLQEDSDQARKMRNGESLQAA